MNQVLDLYHMLENLFFCVAGMLKVFSCLKFPASYSCKIVVILHVSPFLGP